jgi:hypothetical protein
MVVMPACRVLAPSLQLPVSSTSAIALQVLLRQAHYASIDVLARGSAAKFRPHGFLQNIRD